MKIEIDINFKTKKARIAAILISVLFMASLAAWVTALTPNVPTYGQPGSMVTTASYLIFGDGTGNYFARNGTSGGIDFSGTNATAMLQNSFNALRGIGGAVYFKGRLPMTWGLVVYPGMVLQGDGPLSAFTEGTSSLDIPKTLSVPVIKIIVDPLHSSNKVFPILRNFAINGGGSGSNAAQDGIYIDSSNGPVADAYISYVGVFNVGGNCLNIPSNPSATYEKIWVDSFYAEDCLQNGTKQSGGTWVRISNSYFYGNSWNGIYTAWDSLHPALTMVLDSIFYANTKSGIRNAATTTVFVTDCKFTSNGLYGIEATSGGAFVVTGSSFDLNGNSASTDSGGAIVIWSTVSAVSISSSYFTDNGGTTNAVIRMRDPPGASNKITISSNVFLDDRGASATKYFIYNPSGGITATISGNTFVGQLSGNPAILTSNHTATLLIRDNLGYNNLLGLITNPFYSTYVSIAKVGLAGSSAAPVASVTYKAYCVDQHIISTAGTGISITVYDPLGNAVYSGLATFDGMLYVGWAINWGAFSVAPTVVSYGF